jgi:adenosylhomocysteine nucleosidase
LPPSANLAIVAALEREISPLVKSWPVREQTHAGRTFTFFENSNVVVTCGGIGAEPARRAAEAAIALYRPNLICSAGFAGALDPQLRVGEIVFPRRVVNASDGSSLDTGMGKGTLISFNSVAGPEQKASLRNSFAAQAVDMEAASVARAAEAHGIRFAAVKAISDASGFVLPPVDRFTSSSGQFETGRFIAYALVRPWWWRAVARLARNSARASRALCDQLQQMISAGGALATSAHALEAFTKK